MATSKKKKGTVKPTAEMVKLSQRQPKPGLFSGSSIGFRLFLFVAILALMGFGGLGAFFYSRLVRTTRTEIQQQLNAEVNPVAVDLATVEDSMQRQIGQAIAIAGGLTVLALFVVVTWYTRSLNARLQPILDQCNRLVSDRSGQIADLDQSSDEIERLSQSFKQLIEQMQASEQRIREEVALTVQSREQVKRSVELEMESELIETEVGGLLDVVSALEEGDLTVEAEVSDRATGLVADTLNRLIEQLIEIIANVLRSAQQVATGAQDLEALARTSADNTEEQAASVAEGLALVEQVAALAQNTAAQIQTANQALLNVQATVTSGQAAINDLSDGITVLQDGSGKIVQRMKTLGEFVGLAEQFVQDQGQIASLTQVLAINATLVAARAAEQRDPKQFIGVAREFEAIAGQVNDLATQTNEGLAVLQQRTAQIQSVVGAIDSEVQNLGGLVAGFTSGVEKSQDAFYSVRNVTEEVVKVGQTVANSSFEIANASESTAQYIGDISQLAEQTAALTGQARRQSEQMGDLAQRLLERIQFFQLPESELAEPQLPALESNDRFPGESVEPAPEETLETLETTTIDLDADDASLDREQDRENLEDGADFEADAAIADLEPSQTEGAPEADAIVEPSVPDQSEYADESSAAHPERLNQLADSSQNQTDHDFGLELDLDQEIASEPILELDANETGKVDHAELTPPDSEPAVDPADLDIDELLQESVTSAKADFSDHVDLDAEEFDLDADIDFGDNINMTGEAGIEELVDKEIDLDFGSNPNPDSNVDADAEQEAMRN
ncbi:methyl-accepting chemotaxis sensory transducer [Thalassoporum mexicanum PCC 7367]|uniref:methyl-accepting chemotaxis protein n=1 Tax=Thalassoporum mexicanum TaxID=3457544 RepID=UPI00029FA85A|nr:methyl-accepting chemotaxis protein [Pseudanabaena sp. PCC 7367]AFY70627.1 methyl-accepting chemotaxis sensory transducer [Pseudanabaena sp. PCC 7367]